MKKTQKIDLGEYKVIIEYDEDDGSLEVSILDELDDIIDIINISNDENNNEIDLNLN
jgi:hypothetical protein